MGKGIKASEMNHLRVEMSLMKNKLWERLSRRMDLNFDLSDGSGYTKWRKKKAASFKESMALACVLSNDSADGSASEITASSPTLSPNPYKLNVGVPPSHSAAHTSRPRKLPSVKNIVCANTLLPSRIFLDFALSNIIATILRKSTWGKPQRNGKKSLKWINVRWWKTGTERNQIAPDEKNTSFHSKKYGHFCFFNRDEGKLTLGHTGFDNLLRVMRQNINEKNYAIS